MKKSKKTNVNLLKVCISFAIVLIMAVLSEYEVLKNENVASNSNNINQENKINISTLTNIDINSIPEYSGKITIDINNNSKNLITGTSAMNEAMIPLENMVANWIMTKSKEGKDYHVLYRVTPIFEEDNLLASGVLMEAKTVEEDGISFNKFIYNVQDGFKLNYATGESEEI